MEINTVVKDGSSIAYYEAGKGFPILCFAGFGCTHFIYEDLIESLKNDFKFIIIENRGMGKSSATTQDYKLDDLVSDAQFLIEQLKIEKMGVIGISMGGFVAQLFAASFPDKVQALALLCTTSIGADFIHPVALTEEGLRQFATLDPKLAAEYSTIGTTHPNLKLNNPKRFEKIVEQRIKNRTNVEEQIRQNKAAIDFLNSLFEIKKVSCPTLAMSGENDRFVNPKNIDAFKKNISKCVTVVIPESDHFFFMEKPELIALELKKFFEENV